MKFMREISIRWPKVIHPLNIAYLALALLTANCGASSAGTGSSNSNLGSSTAQSSQDRQEASRDLAEQAGQKASAIRDVDFRNFTFPWYPSDYAPPHGRRETILRNAAMKVDGDKNTDRVWIRLANVSYADLTGDGREEAIVTLVANFDPNGSVACTFIFMIEKDKPKLLWSKETGDRANGGLRSIRVIDGSIVMEQYEIEFDWSKGSYEAGASLCCPKRFVRSTYRWNGRVFEKVASETLINEYPTAEFLGYSSD